MQAVFICFIGRSTYVPYSELHICVQGRISVSQTEGHISSKVKGRSSGSSQSCSTAHVNCYRKSIPKQHSIWAPFWNAAWVVTTNTIDSRLPDCKHTHL